MRVAKDLILIVVNLNSVVSVVRFHSNSSKVKQHRESSQRFNFNSSEVKQGSVLPHKKNNFTNDYTDYANFRNYIKNNFNNDYAEFRDYIKNNFTTDNTD